ncbi:MAG: hypothetical protein COW00_06025 [Bdellovibrio sp. CG12_big_fil_rev_8_21_14_0_65_39_13]|nr:MAG: hypothetical protein COW78_18560 [Bdellovibrio sp. CG22_combo_CG10-13_8_21_14_all_39_27]PIQ60786.1 MAG: hypothetical protein COW00_06025 [Bdellovibrio sp. CG12_big_fil_rev_8_21_14_0_65_39_13]PIR36409.1 MAG: hypothetical protein COV37_03365 [Bdellovibrio sp. CG11_big_fil_rev_8_21_14_0_20_39_38]
MRFLLLTLPLYCLCFLYSQNAKADTFHSASVQNHYISSSDNASSNNNPYVLNTIDFYVPILPLAIHFTTTYYRLNIFSKLTSHYKSINLFFKSGLSPPKLT